MFVFRVFNVVLIILCLLFSCINPSDSLVLYYWIIFVEHQLDIGETHQNMADQKLRIAIINPDKCKPKKCR